MKRSVFMIKKKKGIKKGLQPRSYISTFQPSQDGFQSESTLPTQIKMNKPFMQLKQHPLSSSIPTRFYLLTKCWNNTNTRCNLLRSQKVNHFKRQITISRSKHHHHFFLFKDFPFQHYQTFCQEAVLTKSPSPTQNGNRIVFCFSISPFLFFLLPFAMFKVLRCS